MGYTYSKILLDTEFEEFKNENQDSYGNKPISGLEKVNIFIGQNNSGKSRFIRKLFKKENYQFDIKEFSIDKFTEKIDNLNSETKVLKNFPFIKQLQITSSSVIPFVNSLDFKQFFGYQNFYKEPDTKESENPFSLLVNVFNYFSENKVSDPAGQGNLLPFNKYINEKINESGILEVTQNSFDLHRIKRVYIPILRSLNDFQFDLNPSEPTADFLASRIKRSRK